MKIVRLPFDTNVKCNRCGCEFEIDFTDAIYHENFTTYAKKDHYNSANSFSVMCPLCKQDINLKEKRNEQVH